MVFVFVVCIGRRLSSGFKSIYGHSILAIATAFVTISCSNELNSKSKVISSNVLKTAELNIWWEQGLNIDEDQAIQRIVDDWQEETGHKVKLSFYTNKDLVPKAERAIKVGKPPDILMAPKADRVLYPRLAWEGKIEDVSDVIQPLKQHYPEHILRGITYYNSRENRQGYYGVPIYQTTMFVYYWKNLLASVGLIPEDIPQDWDNFWKFWQQAQIELNQKNPDLYALGLTLSGNESSDDTHHLFEQILEAHNITLIDRTGNLNINSQVRQGLIDSLAWYAQIYRQGSIPPNAVRWSNTDNNRALLNRSILMTPNVSQSIPAAIRQDTETYHNHLGISELPHKIDGEPMNYLIFIRQAVIFKSSPHKSLAKEFLRYVIQPETTMEYLKATGSRNQPVQNPVWQDPYWQDTQDPYIATATKILTQGNIRLSYTADNPAYSQVLAENIWGKALTKVTVENISPEQAADEAIARIKQIFAQWK